MDGNSGKFSALATVETAISKISGCKAIFFIGAILLAVLAALSQVLQMGVNLLPYDDATWQKQALSLVISIVIYIVSGMVAWGMLYMGVQRVNDNKLSIAMIGYGFNGGLLLRMIGAILMTLLITLPGLLLIVGGIMAPAFMPAALSAIARLIAMLASIMGGVWMFYIILRLCLVRAILIIEKVGPVTAIAQSFQRTRGHVVALFGILLINIVFAIVLGMGASLGFALQFIHPLAGFFGVFVLVVIMSLWVVPYFFIVQGVMYKRLSQ